MWTRGPEKKMKKCPPASTGTKIYFPSITNSEAIPDVDIYVTF